MNADFFLILRSPGIMNDEGPKISELKKYLPSPFDIPGDLDIFFVLFRFILARGSEV